MYISHIFSGWITYNYYFGTFRGIKCNKLMFYHLITRRSLLRPCLSTISIARCCIKKLEFIQPVIHISNHVNISHNLGGGHTHMDAHTHIHMKVISINQARAWFKNMNGASIVCKYWTCLVFNHNLCLY